MQMDPLPKSRLDSLKFEIKEEIADMYTKSPRGRKASMHFKLAEASLGLQVASTETPSNVVEVESIEEEIENLNVEKTSMKDLVAQINLINEHIPKRL